MVGVLALLTLLHPAPAPAANNRYVKLTCLPDRVRIAFTILYGDQPALPERRRMDADHDGKITPAEAKKFGVDVARRVADGLLFEVGDRRVSVQFAEIDVGLGGDDTVRPVPFSVDLVTTVPLVGPGPHTLHFEDRADLPSPGESEVLLDESPGTRVLASYRGRAGEGVHGLKFAWPEPRRSDLESRLIGFQYGPAPPPTTAPVQDIRRRALILACALAAGAVTAVVLRARRRRYLDRTKG
jgi:hypothetical protein